MNYWLNLMDDTPLISRCNRLKNSGHAAAGFACRCGFEFRRHFMLEEAVADC
jgi:hypothetical protein